MERAKKARRAGFIAATIWVVLVWFARWQLTGHYRFSTTAYVMAVYFAVQWFSVAYASSSVNYYAEEFRNEMECVSWHGRKIRRYQATYGFGYAHFMLFLVFAYLNLRAYAIDYLALFLATGLVSLIGSIVFYKEKRREDRDLATGTNRY